MEVFEGLRTASIADRSKLYQDLASGPFFGFNRPGATPSEGMIDSFWLQGMVSGHKNAYDCIKAFSETDFTDDLKKFDKPTLIIHGHDDQIVPIGPSAHAAVRLIPHARLMVYAGARMVLPTRTRSGSTPTSWSSPGPDQGGACAISARAPPILGMQPDAACRHQGCRRLGRAPGAVHRLASRRHVLSGGPGERLRRLLVEKGGWCLRRRESVQGWPPTKPAPAVRSARLC